MSIEYRKASLHDIDELIKLRIDFLKEAENIQSGNGDSALKASLREYFAEAFKNNRFVAWLALEGNKIVATSGLCFYAVPPLYKNMSGEVAYIMNMYTLPTHRKKGIGTKLFEKILNEAKERGYKKIHLHATEKGKPLYLKFGFEKKNDEMVLNIG